MPKGLQPPVETAEARVVARLAHSDWPDVSCAGCVHHRVRQRVRAADAPSDDEPRLDGQLARRPVAGVPGDVVELHAIRRRRWGFRARA